MNLETRTGMAVVNDIKMTMEESSLSETDKQAVLDSAVKGSVERCEALLNQHIELRHNLHKALVGTMGNGIIFTVVQSVDLPPVQHISLNITFGVFTILYAVESGVIAYFKFQTERLMTMARGKVLALLSQQRNSSSDARNTLFEMLDITDKDLDDFEKKLALSKHLPIDNTKA